MLITLNDIRNGIWINLDLTLILISKLMFGVFYLLIKFGSFKETFTLAFSWKFNIIIELGNKWLLICGYRSFGIHYCQHFIKFLFILLSTILLSANLVPVILLFKIKLVIMLLGVRLVPNSVGSKCSIPIDISPILSPVID